MIFHFVYSSTMPVCRLAAIAQKQLGDTGHSKLHAGYIRRLSRSGADSSGLNGIEISDFKRWVGRQDPFTADATGHEANDGAHADPQSPDAGLAPQYGRVLRDPRESHGINVSRAG